MAFAPIDETYSGWANRQLDDQGNESMLGSLRASTPYTPPVQVEPAPPTLSQILRQMADVLELQEAGDIATDNALELVSDLPAPLGDALAAMLQMRSADAETETEEGDSDGDSS